MKQLLFIVIAITVITSCKAQQTTIIPLDNISPYEFNQNTYLKDVNNDLDKFVGTWKFENQSSEITFMLKKEVQYQLSSDDEYEDMLVGEYQYIDATGVEKVNTLSSFNNPDIKGYAHNINGNIFIHTLPVYCIDNSDASEIKIQLAIDDPIDDYVEGVIILRYKNDNGIEKLEACIYDYSKLAATPDLHISIPDGYYEFVKQN